MAADTNVMPTINIGETVMSENGRISDGAFVSDVNGIIVAANSKHKQFRYRHKRPNHMRRLSLWGNGRDWEHPPAQEGDWVRVYPLGDSPPTSTWDSVNQPNSGHGHAHQEINSTMFGDKEIRSVVINMNRHLKLIKEVSRKHHVNANDTLRNESLMKLLGISGTVWLPPVNK